MSTIKERAQEAQREAARVARKAEDARMIDRPSDWPRWPVLPLKRYGASKPGGMPECGILVAREAGEQHKVFLANMFEFASGKASLNQYPYLEYPTTSAMQDAGWLVD